MADEDKVTTAGEGQGDDGGSADASGGDERNTPSLPAERPGIRELYAKASADAAAAAEAVEVETKPADKPAGDEPAKAADADVADEDKDKPAEGDDEDADVGKPADAATDEAAVAAVAAKQELDDLLETYNDPTVLNAALERAGVEKLAELPAVKSLIGRISQSVRDATKAEIEKAAREASQIADATKEGKAAKDTLVQALKAANDALESDDPNAIVELPTDEAVDDAFKNYADAAVGEYHTRAWNVLSDTIYSLPELGGALPEGYDGPPVPAMTTEQKNLLASVRNADPSTWLAAHLTVQRDVEWLWAQEHGKVDAKAEFEAEKLQIQAAHTNEMKRLTKTHDKAISDAKEEARAEAIADAASGKLGVKLPNKTPHTTERTGDENKPKKGATIREINAWAKEEAVSSTSGREA